MGDSYMVSLSLDFEHSHWHLLYLSSTASGINDQVKQDLECASDGVVAFCGTS